MYILFVCNADFVKGNNSREKNIWFVGVEAWLEVKVDSIFLSLGGEISFGFNSPFATDMRTAINIARKN